MALALFDLDNTLLAGDSDYEWGNFFSGLGFVDAESYKSKNRQFYDDYRAGKLDMFAYQSFCLGALKGLTAEKLDELYQKFLIEVVEPMILAKSQALLNKHSQSGDTVVIITATNRFITQGIAKRYGVDILLATEAVYDNKGGLTGEVVPPPCFHEGKIIHIKKWLLDRKETLKGSYFYSDSFNDLPLLKLVDHPVAVDPDDRLRAHATKQQWPIISLRD